MKKNAKFWILYLTSKCQSLELQQWEEVCKAILNLGADPYSKLIETMRLMATERAWEDSITDERLKI